MELPKNYRDWCVIIVGVLEFKVLLFLWGIFQFSFDMYPGETWYSIWNRWDSIHYQRIAEHFYTPAGLNEADFHFLSHFPPGYPILIDLINLTGLSMVASAFIISIASAALASCVLFELVLEEFKNRNAAFRAVIFMNIFPTAYFTNVPYSDSLYILLSLVAFYFLRVGGYVNRSAIMMGLAIITRVVGITLIPALVVALLENIRQNENACKRLVVVFIPLIFMALYLALNYVYYGNMLFFLKDSATQVHTVKLGFLPFREAITNFLILCKDPVLYVNDNNYMMTSGWNSIIVLAAALFSLCFIKKLPLVYSVYAFGYLFFISSMSWGISGARYVLAIFPLYIGFGLIENRIISITSMGLSVILLLYFSRIFLLGSWAF